MAPPLSQFDALMVLLLSQPLTSQGLELKLEALEELVLLLRLMARADFESSLGFFRTKFLFWRLLTPSFTTRARPAFSSSVCSFRTDPVAKGVWGTVVHCWKVEVLQKIDEKWIAHRNPLGVDHLVDGEALLGVCLETAPDQVLRLIWHFGPLWFGEVELTQTDSLFHARWHWQALGWEERWEPTEPVEVSMFQVWSRLDIFVDKLLTKCRWWLQGTRCRMISHTSLIPKLPGLEKDKFVRACRSQRIVKVHSPT